MRLVIFDVDGTLVDSQAMIVAAMAGAFADEGLEPLPRAEVLGIVGLSLPVAMQVLVPDLPEAKRERLVAGYKAGFTRGREAGHLPPLYPGARAALETLSQLDDVTLGIATGKSRRGLEHLLEEHGLRGWFLTRQVADDHPSKPHPSMIHAAIRETGIEAAVMLGDTSFDMDMARNAGVPGLGVSWGYHSPDVLRASGAREVLEDYAALLPALERIWRG